ncbi:hypothetical protein PVAND_016147 [Polypedilum vanderplanki]|uniref:Uncharacterized protein n=1 Tax=Polypedilum vanderplanki TaxID=319348 RepID=A0A9J6BFC0_POLVA|nr:hypothetical protein PVAND_016147 [Polypedilum vanderplanki]
MSKILLVLYFFTTISCSNILAQRKVRVVEWQGDTKYSLVSRQYEKDETTTLVGKFNMNAKISYYPYNGKEFHYTDKKDKELLFDNPSWVQYKGYIPPRAFIAGYENEGSNNEKMIYVCQRNHEGVNVLCKLIEKTCLCPYNGLEYKYHEKFNVLIELPAIKFGIIETLNNPSFEFVDENSDNKN